MYCLEFDLYQCIFYISLIYTVLATSSRCLCRTNASDWLCSVIRSCVWYRNDISCGAWVLLARPPTHYYLLRQSQILFRESEKDKARPQITTLGNASVAAYIAPGWNHPEFWVLNPSTLVRSDYTSFRVRFESGPSLCGFDYSFCVLISSLATSVSDDYRENLCH